MLKLWFRRNSGLRNSSKPEELHSSPIFLVQTVGIISRSQAVTSKWQKDWKNVSCSGVEVDKKKEKLSITIWQLNFRAYRHNRGDSADILHICGKHRKLLYKEPWEGEEGCQSKVSFCLTSTSPWTMLINFSFYTHFGVWKEMRQLRYTQGLLSTPVSNFLPRTNACTCSEGCTGRPGGCWAPGG